MDRALRPGLALLVLVLASVSLPVGVVELALRWRAGDLSARPSPAAGELHLVGEDKRYPAVYDPLLGWIPTPGSAGTDNVWGTQVTIEPTSLRSNGAPRPEGSPVLVVGDSFAFGDEGDDASSWPAQLEALLDRPVHNGGVFGYGVDQIVLRAEQLLEGASAEAEWVVLSLLPDDVPRCEFAYRFAWKPYFEIEDDRLVLRNVPPPEPHQGPPGESALRRGLRHSFVADRVLRLLDPDGWAIPDSVRVHHEGAEVARRLLDRLVTRVRGEERRLLLVLQWAPREDDSALAELAARAHARGVPVVDLRDALEPLVRRKGVEEFFFVHERDDPDSDVPRRHVGHPTREGNRITARAVARALRRAAPAGALREAREEG